MGERLTLADISLACSLILLFEKGLNRYQRAPYVHLFRWFDTIINQPYVKAGLSDLTLETIFIVLLNYKILGSTKLG